MGARANARYFDGSHRQRAYRKRVEAAATAAGIPARVSLHAVEAATHPQGRNGDAHKPPRARPARRTELRVSYRRVIATLDDLEGRQVDREALLALQDARDAILGLLTTKQRAALPPD